jgi:hypothetical protein
MIEQYIYNKITEDETLQELLNAGSDDFYLYPAVVPRGIENFDVAVTFTLITSTDVYPASKSVNIQFNIFGAVHADVAEVAQALEALFNEDNNQSDGDVSVVYSQRVSESDLGKSLDNEALYQREATYYFKLR